MENLKKLMQETGKNQREIGELLGVTQTHISKLLLKREKPSKALELSVERMLNGFQNIPIDPRSKALIEIFESLPENSKKDIYSYAKKEKRLADLDNETPKRKAA